MAFSVSESDLDTPANGDSCWNDGSVAVTTDRPTPGSSRLSPQTDSWLVGLIQLVAFMNVAAFLIAFFFDPTPLPPSFAMCTLIGAVLWVTLGRLWRKRLDTKNPLSTRNLKHNGMRPTAFEEALVSPMKGYFKIAAPTSKSTKQDSQPAPSSCEKKTLGAASRKEN